MSNICYISAFYDTNRENWPTFSRTFKDYIDEDNIMVSISKDAYLMADTMIDVRNIIPKSDILPH
jgi:hypothetical protein